MRQRLEQLRTLARTRWNAVLAAPGGAGRVARGGAAGAFAAMIPAFGLHLALAIAIAFILRGSLAAAAAACLLIGNPLVHAVELPIAYELGRWLISTGYPGPVWLPAWSRTLLPIAEEALAGGALIGLVAALPAFFGIRRAVAHRLAPPGPRSGDPPAEAP